MTATTVKLVLNDIIADADFTFSSYLGFDFSTVFSHSI